MEHLERVPQHTPDEKECRRRHKYGQPTDTASVRPVHVQSIFGCGGAARHYKAGWHFPVVDFSCTVNTVMKMSPLA